MLILNPGLMASMDDDHLIRVLECEPAIMRTPAEIGQTVANAAAYGADELNQILNPKKEK